MKVNLFRIITLAVVLSGSVCALADFNPDNPPEPFVTRRLTVGITPAEAGTVAGEGNYPVGQMVNISTTPAKDYTFLYWTLNGVQHSTSLTFMYQMGDSAAAFVAHYKYDPPIIPDEPFDPVSPPEPYVSQLVTVTANPAVGGITRGSGAYTARQSATIEVLPYTQYAFDSWTLNGHPYPQTNTQFNYVVGDSAAHFVANLIEKHLITVKTHPRAAGTSHMTVNDTDLNSEILIPGVSVALTTTGNPDYRFRYWALNGRQYNTNPTCNYIMGDTTASLVAVYDYIGTGDTTLFNPDNPPEPMLRQDVTIQVISANPTLGSAAGSGTYPFASSVTITATPVPGYVFRYWHDGNKAATRTVIAERDSLFIAYFGNDTCRIDTTICYGETLQVGDTILSRSGHREFQTMRPDGLYTWNIVDLTVWHPMSSTMNVSICQGDTFAYEGGRHMQQGTYVDTLQNFLGCDSVVTVNLTVYPVFDTTIVAAICASERYTLNGFSADSTGEYVQYLSTIHGCDSIVRLSLTVHAEYDTTIVARICRGETYDLNGFNETDAGDYTLNLKSQYGCDSIVRLQLGVDSVPTVFYYDTICQGDIYTWRTLSYTPMHDTLCWDKESCDTTSCGYILHELHLVVHPQLRIRWQEQSYTLCHNAERPDIYYTVLAGSPATFSLTMEDTVSHRRATWSNRPISQGISLPLLPDTLYPGYYRLSIVVQDSFCSPAEVTMRVEINYVADSLITQRWGDLLAVRKTAYDRYGGFTAYQWYRDGMRMDGETATTLYQPTTGLDGHTYQVEVTRQTDGVTLISCPFTPTPQPSTITLIVTPSALAPQAPMRIRSSQAGSLYIYNREGAAVRHMQIPDGDTQINAPAASGIYLLQLTTSSGEQHVQKLLVY